MSDKVFCVECHKLNKKSKCWLIKDVWHRDTSSKFYDEDGDYHYINSQCTTFTYICEFGHKWTKDYKSGCHIHTSLGQTACKYKPSTVEKPVVDSWFKRLFKRK